MTRSSICLAVASACFGRAPCFLDLVHAVAHTLGASVEHGDNRLVQHQPQQVEQDGEIDQVPHKALPVQPQRIGNCFHTSLALLARFVTPFRRG